MRSEKYSIKIYDRIKRAVIITAIILLSVSLISVIVSVFIVDAIFSRREINPYDPYMAYSAEDAVSYPRTGFEFSSDGKTLRGYIYGEDSCKGLIIIANGFNADISSHLGEVFWFVDDGWTVLTFDGTGVGESDGRSVIGLEQTRRDLLALLDYIGNADDLAGLPLFLYGHSTGGYAAASLSDDDRISATVSISGFNSSLDMMHFYSRKYVGALADLGYPFMRVYNRMLFGSDGDITAAEHIAASEHPVMIVHGSGDVIVPVEQSIYRHCCSGACDNVEVMLLDEEYRNRHSTIWLDAEAAREFTEYREKEASAVTEYGMKHMPDELAGELLRNAQASNDILRNVDAGFLGGISEFFSQALTAGNIPKSQ